MEIKVLLSRLERVRKSANGWTARCPAHDDTTPSLAVSLGEDGRVLLKCFAGCELPAIVGALGVAVADLFVGPAPAGLDPDVKYDYRDERGALLFQVVRGPGKRFRQRQPDGRGGWTWNLAGVRRVLYRVPELRAADAGREVYIVEGEKDVETLRRLGLVATTNPQGAGKWRPELSETLRGRDVVILPDNDEPGRKHADSVARLLAGVARSVRIVELPGLATKGDVTDRMAAGNPAERLRELVAATPALGAPSPKPPATVITLADVEPEQVEWLWAGRIPRGKLTLLDGDPGLGKSTVAYDIAARVTRGLPMPGEPVGGKVFMETYAKANNKPSEQASKQSILDNYLLPRFRTRRLDSFKVLDIDELKAEMIDEGFSRKTINNAMAVWAKLLHYAQDQELIAKTPRFKFLKIREEKFDFFDFDELERLISAAKDEPDRRAMILLGAEAGLRMGEMLALTQDCVDYRSGNVTIWENDWHGQVGSTKGGDRRTVPMTPRLRAALQAIRHLRAELVLCGPDGSRWTKHMVRAALRTICRRAGLRVVGAHVLRHTFCSHLAMRKAAPKAIQELAGHKSLKVTLRYMHLTETALRQTMRLLEDRDAPAAHAANDTSSGELTAR